MTEMMITAIAIPFFLISIIWEVRVVGRRRAAGDRSILGYEKRDTWASVLMGLVSLATVALLNLAIIAISEVLWHHRVTDLGSSWLGWTVAMIGWDFAYYWTHRWEHEVRFFWAAHVNHHSSEYYNLSTALRQPWTPLLILATFPPLALLGVSPELIMAAGGVNLLYQFWIHTEAIDRLPEWFEFIFNTPSHHRVHHGTNPQYLDRNHGGILILWDRMFGSFEPEVDRVLYGITKNIHTFNLWRIFDHEYVAMFRDAARATTWRDRFGYVFRGPGWAPAPALAVSSGVNEARMPAAPSSHDGGR